METITTAFQRAAASMPFYQKILKARGLDPAAVNTSEDFRTLVPIIGKEDVFPCFALPELCQESVWQDMASAIFSSGSSGVFSYGLLTKHDLLKQQCQLDDLLRLFFNAEASPPILINALSMGVSFASEFPVIQTSVRSDIVLQVIRTMREHAQQIVVVTDPHFAKKVIEDGIEEGIAWGAKPITFILGGTWTSNSLIQYLRRLINVPSSSNNMIYGTMGLTELGLNIFFQAPDLIEIQDQIQHRPQLLKQLFGNRTEACPSLMYYMRDRMHIEVPYPDENGFGDVVISHLDVDIKTLLMRYNTGDQGKMIDVGALVQALKKNDSNAAPALPLPIVAIRGRSNEFASGRRVTVSMVKEAIYRDAEIARCITGHFRLHEEGDRALIRIHLKPRVTHATRIEEGIGAILGKMNVGQVVVQCVPYREFEHDVELNYESKWKHI
jgi:phenylacetate-CoA ligase